MKRVHTSSGILFSLVSVLGISAAFAAPTRHPDPTAPAALAVPSKTTVYQRQADSGSIELSNIPAEGTLPIPISIETDVRSGASASETKSAVSESVATTQPKAKKKVLKKIKNADGVEEEVWVDADEDVDGTDTAATDAAQAGAMSSTSGSSGGSSWSSASPQNSGGGYSGGGYYGGGLTGGGVDTGSTPASSGGNVSNGGTTTTTGNNGGTSSGIPLDPTLPAPTTPLQTKLNNYRTMMLNEVITSTVANPAIARRYQMVNRATYQSLLGY